MNLRTTIIGTYEERFSHDKAYLLEKLEKINECQSTSNLLYFCMNIDDEGLAIIGQLLYHENFKKFVFDFRDIDQS